MKCRHRACDALARCADEHQRAGDDSLRAINAGDVVDYFQFIPGRRMNSTGATGETQAPLFEWLFIKVQGG